MVKSRLVTLRSLLVVGLLCGAGLAQGEVSLAEGFAHPPTEAKPLVWWHWMNGNITKEGIQLDLEWMHRVGIGGVQLFEAGMPTPPVVSTPLGFMSDGWQEALRFGSDTSQRLGLPMTITTSPGWSETGGPWVKPEDAMKKMVWSETVVSGGMPVRMALARPPDVAGPFQDVSRAMVSRESVGSEDSTLYADSVVLAFPGRWGTPLTPKHARGPCGTIGISQLVDGRFGASQAIKPAAGGGAYVEYEFARPVLVRSVRAGLPGLRGFATPPPVRARLESSIDGAHFQTVVDLFTSASPVRSASFPGVTARFYRLTLEPAADAGEVRQIADGAALPAWMTALPKLEYQVSEFDLFAEGRVNAAEEKAGFATVPDYYAFDTQFNAHSPSVAHAGVVDLTKKMTPDGRLDWTPPGRAPWTILRIGYSLTGHRNGPAPAFATGLEVDKLDPQRVRDYLDAYLKQYDHALGTKLGGSSAVTSLLSDSIESGPQNWTDRILEEFTRLRGYDPRPWLPSLTGIVVDDAATSDRFLWDFRRTLAQLIADAHYGVIAAEAHSRGLKYFAEALEDHRPQLGDDVEMRRYADTPMGAMWMTPKGMPARATLVADLQGAASVAHVYGKARVAAESFTASGSPWAFSPRDLKSTADLEMLLGVNQFAIHESAHQPLANKRPGLALAVMLGQYFNRNETWAEQAGAWTSYLARSCFLLQQGRFAADIAYFYGEEAPLTGLYGERPVDVPTGYAFDFVGADALLNRLSVDKGDLVTLEGQRYRFLYLGGSSRRMTLPIVRRLQQLIAEGATIIGPRPEASPSLADGDAKKYENALDMVWGPVAGRWRSNHGGLLATSLEGGLQQSGIAPDWSWSGGGLTSPIAVLHRTSPAADIYFVSNRRNLSISGTLSVRGAGRAPDLFFADSGESAPASYRIHDNRTDIPLQLEEDGSVFVVLQKPTTTDSRQLAATRWSPLLKVGGKWAVHFQGLAAPADQQFATLQSWNTAQEPDLKYFSGTGVYSTAIRLTKKQTRQVVAVDLGEVDDIAELRVNGHSTGTAWKPPYRLDVRGLLHEGRNLLEVRVTNLWVNRLIGDAQPGANAVAFTTDPAYTSTAALRSSGLLGPVRFVTQVDAH